MASLRVPTPADAAAWAAVVQAASPFHVLDADSEEHAMRTDPPDARRLVAEVDGGVVGVGRFRSYAEEDHASLSVTVHPAHRRQGIGGQLLDALDGYVAASGRHRATVIVNDDDDSRIACSRWGFSIIRTFQTAMVDPREVPAPPEAPAGVRVVSIAAMGPEAVWRVHQLVARDDPSGLTLPMPYDDWLADWADPRARPELGRAVMVGEELAAYTLLGASGDRAWSGMTGTAPEYRGRGFAGLAKQRALRAAAAAGIQRAMTGNDSRNAPMLAVNARLGYRGCANPALAERRSVGSGHP